MVYFVLIKKKNNMSRNMSKNENTYLRKHWYFLCYLILVKSDIQMQNALPLIWRAFYFTVCRDVHLSGFILFQICLKWNMIGCDTVLSLVIPHLHQQDFYHFSKQALLILDIVRRSKALSFIHRHNI